MQAIQGIHHITAIASDPQKNVDFYHEILGQRLVKTTVNFDDPGTYHLYYGDETGSPGTIMTYFPWQHLKRGRPGNGEVAAIAYSIAPQSTDFWRERLTNYGILIQETTRFGETVLIFHDPDGIALELITNPNPATFRHWATGPIPEEHALRGFHGVTIWLDGAAPTAHLLTEVMGYERIDTDGNRSRFAAASNDIGLYVDLVERPGEPRGTMGAGTVHHVAFRTVDDEEQLGYRQKFIEAGMNVTGVRDRQYFHSIYFREPAGTLFEVATDAPGFPYDEPIAELGTHLKLPPWLETQREAIEAHLPTFSIPQFDKAGE